MVRVLLDENIPKALRKALGGFDVSTVQYMGWAGLKNGELLSAAEAAGLDVFVTGDKTVQFEQNMSRWKIAVVSLSAPHWPIIKNHVERIGLANRRSNTKLVHAGRCGRLHEAETCFGSDVGVAAIARHSIDVAFILRITREQLAPRVIALCGLPKLCRT